MRTQSNGKQTGVFLVDDHPLVRDSLKQILLREPDLAVCGEAEDRKEALEGIRDTQPSLVIVDLKLRNSDGLDLIKDICRHYPKMPTLVLSMYADASHAERAIRSGACGYISKQEAAEGIVQAIRTVLAGEIYWSPRAASQVASRVARPARQKGEVNRDLLTERELEVFELIGTGSSTMQVSQSLHIDVSTVETYRARIKEKLHLKDKTELLQRAIRWNLDRATG